MRHRCPRSVTVIDTDLLSLSAIRRDAQAELAQVRRRQVELAEIEAGLVVAIEVRSRRIDEALDERLQAALQPRLLGAGEPAAFADAR